MSKKALEKTPRLDKRWIQSRVEEEIHQAVQYVESMQVPHWTLDQHEHRNELTKMIHAATQGVATKKIKPMKPYVTDEILEVSKHRTMDKRRVLKAWKKGFSLDCRPSETNAGSLRHFW